VAPAVPYPLDSGWKQRTFNIVRTLSALGEVDLVCCSDPTRVGEVQDFTPLTSLCREVHVMPTPPASSPLRTYRAAVSALLLSRRPYFVAEFDASTLLARAHELAAEADLVWASRIFVAEWLSIPPGKMIVDLDDLESVKEGRRLGLTSLRPWQLAMRFDNRKLRHVERRSAGRYLRVVLCTERDRAFFPPRTRDRVIVLPNGIDGALLEVPRGAPAGDDLVMVGNFRYAPNVDGASWLVREVMPLVWAERPRTRLLLVGDDARGLARPLHDGQRVVVTGRVPEVTPYVTAAAASVVPIRVGGGTRIKILESMALRTPVISTGIGAEGIEAVDGRHLRLADTPQAFARAVVELIADRARAAALGQAGAALVAERYTWRRIRAGLGEQLRPLLPSARLDPAPDAALPWASEARSR
jgi:glycosyltransferase involved in cell wall biosynthesis